MRSVLEDLNLLIGLVTGACGKVAQTLMCIHYHSPCGYNSVHVPTFICPDVCDYVSTELCSTEWEQAEMQIPSIHGEQYALPNCSHVAEHLKFLNLSSDCCTNGGVTLPG